MLLRLRFRWPEIVEQCEREETKAKMSNRYLPEDVLIQILSTLPAKCLLRFKCVCKSWYALIADPDFISKHLAWATSRNPHRGVILNCVHEITLSPSLSLLSRDTLEVSRDTLEVSRYVDISQFFSQEIFTLKIYGPSIGILCLHGWFGVGEFISDRLVLWNPTTSESKVLPMLDPMLVTSSYGFGFDPKTNDYKVVGIRGSLVEVYSLRADSWKVINPLNPAYKVSSPRYPSYLNGVQYWKAFERGNRDRRFLLSFDMSNEVFQEILLPPLCEIHSFFEVAVINDSVALVFANDRGKWFDIRVMIGSGPKGTWTKFSTIGPFPQLCRLLEFRDDGLVLLRDGNGWLVLCHPIRQERWDLRVCGGHYHQVWSYTETLVVLNK